MKVKLGCSLEEGSEFGVRIRASLPGIEASLVNLCIYILIKKKRSQGLTLLMIPKYIYGRLTFSFGEWELEYGIKVAR